ncbi:serine/threonine protein kinase, partial [Streptomyces sp. MCAF7]
GQYRIRGLAVMAALRGISSDHPQRTDTEAIGALLYAALTQRWPYERDAYGLSGLPKGVGLIAPDQVRAGVHRGLSELAMRALVNDGATASRQDQPCTTPEELSKAVAAMPRIRPPEPTFTAPDAFQRTTYQQGVYGRPPHHGRPSLATGPAVPVPPPPPLQSRTGKALKWTVSALLIAALGLGSWQLADTLLKEEKKSPPSRSQQKGNDDKPTKSAGKQVKIVNAREFAPGTKPQNPAQAKLTYDGDASSSWRTSSYIDGPEFAPSVKKGVGIIYDLGSERTLDSATLGLLYGGPYTKVSLYATGSLSPSVSGSDPVASFQKLGSDKIESKSAELKIKSKVKTRYVLVWLTALPYSAPEPNYDNPYKQAITDVKFTG